MIFDLRVERLLTKYLNLGEGEEHPLPWYPPFCSALVSEPAELDLPCCDHLLGVQRAKKKDREHLVAEPQLKAAFLSLADTNVETEAEMGQRIHTLFKYNVGPKWVLLNLAALYWRVVGVAAEATGCLRLALSEAEVKGYSDVALVQLSQLASIAGDRLDDGIVLIKQALHVDSREPSSHFLLGYYLALKRNSSGAEHHLIEALNLDPRFPGAIEALKSVRCQQKYTPTETEDQHASDKTSMQMCGKKPAIPKFFCIKVSNGEERCYLEEKVNPSLSQQTSSSCSSRRKRSCENPVCVAPPPLAPLLFPIIDKNTDLFCPSSSSQKKKNHGESCATEANVSQTERDLGSSPLSSNLLTTPIESSTSPAVETDEEQGEVTLDSDNVLKATGRELTAPPPPVKPPPSKHTVRYGTKGKDLSPEDVSTKEEEDENTELLIGNDARRLAELAEAVKYEPRPKEEEAAAEKDKSSKTVPGAKDCKMMDSPLPEVLPAPYPYQIRGGARLVPSLPTSTAECEALKKHVKLDQATSTWLSVTAKGVRLDQFIDFSGSSPKEFLEPLCPAVVRTTMWTMDHLHGFKLNHNSTVYKPEKGLKDVRKTDQQPGAFQNLGNKKDTLQGMATRLYRAMKTSRKNPQIYSIKFNMHPFDTWFDVNYEGGVHWSLTTVGALYWRVQGNLSMSVRCLRHALNNAPYHMRDLALVSLANVYHQAGMLHSALITAGAALQLSPRFVVIHFTLANIYSAMGDLDHAMMFYYSTLALQNNFDPARERIRAIYCLTGRIPSEALNVED